MATEKSKTKEQETISNAPEKNELNGKDKYSERPVKKSKIAAGNKKTATPKKTAVEKKKAVSRELVTVA